MAEEPKECRWWQRHKWTAWAVTPHINDGYTYSAIYQRRHCERCGKIQQEYVGPKP